MSSKPKDKAKFSFDEIARTLESIKRVQPGGGVSFGGSKFHELKTVILTSIKWDESLSDYERERIAFKMPFEASASGKITKDSLLNALRQLESEKFSGAVGNYAVISSLSFSHSKLLTNLVVGNVRFSFHSKMPKGFDRTAIKALLAGHVDDCPNGYVIVRGDVSEKSIHGAVSETLSALDLLRGVWNYIINQRTDSIIRFGGGYRKTKALNKIRLGPVHTVHLPQGPLAVKQCWSEPFFEAGDPEFLDGEWPKIQKAASWCLRRYHSIPYFKDATTMWIRYAYALDRADMEASFLKLWGLLEFLTGTTGERYDETIRRTLFLCDDREFHRLILEHLRDRRNALVHHDDGSSEAEQHVFQLKRYVEELMRLHLVMGKRFKSMAEFGEFLSLPPEPAVLKEKLRQYRQALGFRERTIRAATVQALPKSPVVAAKT